MSFRDKEKRRGPVDKRTTIDAVHQEKVSEFINEEKSIPYKEKELKKLKIEYLQLNKKTQIELTDIELQKKLELHDKIKELDKIIEKLKEKKDRTDYYLKNGHLIYQYYDSKSSEGTKNVQQNVSKKNSIINLFQKEKIEEKKKSERVPEGTVSVGIKQVQVQKKISKSSILNQYMSHIDSEFIYNIKDKENDTCSVCNGDLYLLPIESIMVCKECGLTEDIIINSDKPSYKDPPREVSYFAYKRINHFNEWLAQFQAKESTEIPEEVYSKIIKELNKEKIVSANKLIPEKLREILKKLKYNKYYEHVPHIINHLNGVPAPSMSRNTEEKLRMMFKEIQTPFVKYCPKDRKNFLSYSYVLHKFCELLSLDEYLECFPLLKSREKLQQQDNIWEKICYDLQWEYIPST